MAETVERWPRPTRPPQGTRVTTHMADVSIEAELRRFRDEVAAQHETDKLHLLFNNAGIGGGGSMIADSPRGLGADLQRLLGRGLLRRAHLPADADEGRRGAHHQHLQRQRLLGQPRAGRLAHRLFGGEVRGEGLHRGADHRPPAQRAAHQVLGGHARPHRHLDRRELAQGAGAQRLRRDVDRGARARAQALRGRRRGRTADRRDDPGAWSPRAPAASSRTRR